MPEEPLKLSASGVKSYLECPYRFARDHVDRLPDHERAPSPALSFGISVHRALAEYFRRGGKACNTGNDLIALLRSNWHSAGYANVAGEQAYVNRGMAAMRKVWMADYPPPTADILGIERWAEWPRPCRGILARGKLDLVYRLPNRSLVVVDWKTGERPAPAEDLWSDPQAWFYRTISAATIGDHDKTSGIRISFRYIELGETVSIDFEKDDFAAATRRIIGVARSIREGMTQLGAGAPLDEAFPRRIGHRCAGCPMRLHCRVGGRETLGDPERNGKN